MGLNRILMGINPSFSPLTLASAYAATLATTAVALAHALGYRIAEAEVRHHPRAFARSRYGWSRLPKGVLDLLTVFLLGRFRERPLHLFGGLGVVRNCAATQPAQHGVERSVIVPLIEKVPSRRPRTVFARQISPRSPRS